MASQEHLQMLDDGDSTSTSSGDEDESTTSSEGDGDTQEAPAATPTPASLSGVQAIVVAAAQVDDGDDDNDESEEELVRMSAPPKKRIKLSLGRIKAADDSSTPDLQPTLEPKFIPETKTVPAQKAGPEPKTVPPPKVVPATKSANTSKAIPGPKLVPSLLKKKSPPKEHKKPTALKKLPTQANKAKAAKKKLIKLARPSTSASEDGAEEIKAMIVDSDEGGEDDAVAAIVEEATSKDPTPKRRPANPVKAIRLPSMNSPGLLIPATSGIYRGSADSNGFTTPASVFDHAMSLAGYTTEGRTKHPHRGSSVKRVVGDMFDSNVKFTLHFPKLVPDNLLKPPTTKPKEEAGAQSLENGTSTDSLSQRLIRALDNTTVESRGQSSLNPSPGEHPRKRRKLMRFSDMAPLSLTLSYPEKYIQKRLQFVRKVKERERSIVKSQQQEEQLEIARERSELPTSKSKSDGKEPKRIIVPPIPQPPSPPRINELEGINVDEYEDHHPDYPLKGKEQFVSHLDKQCYHIVEGRYFGLLTNGIADPHFVGPNAPGIAGLNLSGGTGLATAHAGGGALTGSASVLAASAAAVAAVPTSGGAKTNTSSVKPVPKKPAASTSNSGTNAPTTVAVTKKKSAGPTPTASSSALRKILEEGGEAAEKMKKCIIRAAVHASRSGKHGQSFRAPNGQTYPDVSKAFAGHAGLKPCMRCKNNKQGAYHCRLRRKHKELDYDGSNSTEILAPLFQVPMNELLWSG